MSFLDGDAFLKDLKCRCCRGLSRETSDLVRVGQEKAATSSPRVPRVRSVRSSPLLALALACSRSNSSPHSINTSAGFHVRDRQTPQNCPHNDKLSHLQGPAMQYLRVGSARRQRRVALRAISLFHQQLCHRASCWGRRLRTHSLGDSVLRHCLIESLSL